MENIKASFNKANFTEKVCSNGKMDHFIKEIIKMTKRTDLENIWKKMEKLLKDIGKMVSDKVKALSPIKQAKSSRAAGLITNFTDFINIFFFTTINSFF
jgi:hypothetical protein